jgi:hypothetical protein
MRISILTSCLIILSQTACIANKHKTNVEIRGDEFYINSYKTYEGRYWKGNKIEGLLLNSRMVQGVFDDLNKGTAGNWAYTDTGEWDPDRNTNEFVKNMASWRKAGLLSITINMQGGSPHGYSKEQPWANPGYFPDGSLRPDYLCRLKKILDKADELGMVPILGLFYFGQDERLTDETAVINAVNNMVNWLKDQGYHNILIEINNECNIKYDHEILKPARVNELIDLVKANRKNGYRFYAGTSFGGGTIPVQNVIKASDFIIMHGNGVSEPSKIAEMVKKVREAEGYKPKPVIFNEDDHYDFKKENNNFISAVKSYASWGYFDFRREGEPFSDGYQSVPVSWKTDSDRKISFFRLLKEITGSN